MRRPVAACAWLHGVWARDGTPPGALPPVTPCPSSGLTPAACTPCVLPCLLPCAGCWATTRSWTPCPRAGAWASSQTCKSCEAQRRRYLAGGAATAAAPSHCHNLAATLRLVLLATPSSHGLSAFASVLGVGCSFHLAACDPRACRCRGLASNNWTGTLPSQWAGANAFPKLLQL